MMDKQKKNLLVFGYGLGLIAAVFAIGGAIKHGVHLTTFILWACSAVFITVTSLNWKALKPAYEGWMKIAHLIGGIVTTLILTIVFFVVFTPIGLILRLLGKDHLGRKLDPNAKTYWEQRNRGLFNKQDCHQQY